MIKKWLHLLLQNTYQDHRRILNELQRYSVSGRIDKGILSASLIYNLPDLLSALKSKDFAPTANGSQTTLIMTQQESFVNLRQPIEALKPTFCSSN